MFFANVYNISRFPKFEISVQDFIRIKHWTMFVFRNITSSETGGNSYFQDPPNRHEEAESWRTNLLFGSVPLFDLNLRSQAHTLQLPRHDSTVLLVCWKKERKWITDEEKWNLRLIYCKPLILDSHSNFQHFIYLYFGYFVIFSIEIYCACEDLCKEFKK